MLYRINRGGVTGYTGGQCNLVYLVTDLRALLELQLGWVATDRNAALADARYTARPEALAQHVDWAVMETQQWANTAADGQRKQRRMAEFLVPRHVPWSAFKWSATHDEASVATVRKEITGSDHHPGVYVRADWYF